MNNENTFPYKTNIIVEKKPVFIPQTGDELVFCADEDVALTSYKNYVDGERDNEYEPIEEEFLTDFFKLQEVNGTVYEPVYFGAKKYGMFGCRTKLASWITEGHFYLYEME